MNITIISPVLPYPLDSGGAQAQFNMIDRLRSKHDITYIFVQTRYSQGDALKKLPVIWPNVDIVSYSYLRQVAHWRFFKDKMVRAVKMRTSKGDERFKVERAIKPYGVYFTNDFVCFVNEVINRKKTDVIQVEFFPCLHIVNYLQPGIKRIFIHHEIRFIRNERLLKNLTLTEEERHRCLDVKNTEIEDLNKYDAVVTLTDTDKGILRTNGVTSSLYVSPAAINARQLTYKEWTGKITFVGGYSHIPNKEGLDWFLTNVLPEVKTDVSLQVVGSGWPASSYENRWQNVEFLGFVEHLEDAVHGSIMIVPILTGSGMRMKILEAAAMSVPFITTSVGVEGLDFKHDESCLVADTAEEFANAIDCLANDAVLRKRLTENASKVFENKYSAQALSDVRDNIYCNVVKNNVM